MKKTIVGIGELLWDLLPSGERLGGAPANFAVMASRLGNRGVIASRLGRDERGERARRVLQNLPVDTGFLQTDPAMPTGTVGVEIVAGEPHYLIHEPVAWDCLEWTAEWAELAEQADAVCFGTLAQRERTSRTTILRFLQATRPDCIRVFDVNLRAPFFNADTVEESLMVTSILKLNEAEVPQVMSMLGRDPCPPEDEDALRAAAECLLSRFPLKLVAITMGADGSLLVTRESTHRRRGIHGEVVDTVGAGDAFAAAMVDSYLAAASVVPAGASLARMNEAGNRWGGWVASQRGAMPDLSAATLGEIQSKIAAA